MNYYSIEFFKHNLKELNAHVKRMNKLNVIDSKNLNTISKKIDEMLGYVSDRENNNKSAYSKKHMRELNFK